MASCAQRQKAYHCACDVSSGKQVDNNNQLTMATAQSSSSSDSENSDYSVNSGYDSDHIYVSDNHGILPYHYEPPARAADADQARIPPENVRVNRAGTTTW